MAAAIAAARALGDAAADRRRCRRMYLGAGRAADGVRSRVTGSGPTKGSPVLSAARQRGSSSGLGAVTKDKPLRTPLRHPSLPAAKLGGHNE
eukprot:362814-Chlamydomonas_euryale.AAC.4